MVEEDATEAAKATIVAAKAAIEAAITASSLSGLSHKTSDIGKFSCQRWRNMAFKRNQCPFLLFRLLWMLALAPN